MDMQPSSRHYGTIIVDATWLRNMAEIKPFSADGIPLPAIINPFNILSVLAQKGYSILIPETVAVEAGSTLADGTYANDVLFNNQQHESSHAISTFLKQVASSKHPNIQIVRNTGPEEADNYCRRLHGILAKAHRIHSGAYDRTDELNSLRTQCVRLHEQRRHNNLGDKAIFSLMHQLSADTKPCILTDDVPFRRMLDSQQTQGLQCEKMSTIGLLHLFKHHEMFPCIGISPDMDIDASYALIAGQAIKPFEQLPTRQAINRAGENAPDLAMFLRELSPILKQEHARSPIKKFNGKWGSFFGSAPTAVDSISKRGTPAEAPSR